MPRVTFKDCATVDELAAGATLVRDTWVVGLDGANPPPCPDCGAPLYIDETTEHGPALTPIFAAGCSSCEFVHGFPVR